MGLDPNNAILHRRLEKASQSAEQAGQDLQDTSESNRKTFERFYNTLALVSGGTLALSITFLGSLKGATGASVNLLPLLHTSWGFLLIALLSSLLRNWYYPSYLHYATFLAYAEAKAKQRKVESESATTLNIVNFQNPEEATAAAERLREISERWETQILSNRNRVTLYERLWLLSQHVARICFVIGLISLLGFATSNT